MFLSLKNIRVVITRRKCTMSGKSIPDNKIQHQTWRIRIYHNYRVPWPEQGEIHRGLRLEGRHWSVLPQLCWRRDGKICTVGEATKGVLERAAQPWTKVNYCYSISTQPYAWTGHSSIPMPSLWRGGLSIKHGLYNPYHNICRIILIILINILLRVIPLHSLKREEQKADKNQLGNQFCPPPHLPPPLPSGWVQVPWNFRKIYGG